MKMKHFGKLMVSSILGLSLIVPSGSAYAASEHSDAASEYSEFSEYPEILSKLTTSGNYGGSYYMDADTREVSYIPTSDVAVCSDETEMSSPAYNPFAGEDEPEAPLQTFSISETRGRVLNPQYNEMCRNTVFIYAETANGGTLRGTGFLIGPNAVATTGEMLYSEDYGGNGWITYSSITPAYNTGSERAKWGSAEAKGYRVGSGWASEESLDDDWGVITLKTNIGSSVGWLGLRSGSSYKGTSVHVNGYPLNVNGYSGVQYDQFSSIGSISVDTSKYATMASENIYTSYGDYGGPCYAYYQDLGYTAIGICTFSVPNSTNTKMMTSYRKIDSYLYNILVSYRTSTL